MSMHSSFHIAGTATVGPKGQVVIPVEVRDQMGIAPGDKVIALVVDGHQSVSFITEKEASILINTLGERVTYPGNRFELRKED